MRDSKAMKHSSPSDICHTGTVVFRNRSADATKIVSCWVGQVRILETSLRTSFVAPSIASNEARKRVCRSINHDDKLLPSSASAVVAIVVLIRFMAVGISLKNWNDLK